MKIICRRFLICGLILVGGCSPLRNSWQPAPLPERPLTELRAEIMEKDAHPLDEHFGTLVSLSFGDSLLAAGPEEARSEFQVLLGTIGVGELGLTTEEVQSCGTGLTRPGSTARHIRPDRSREAFRAAVSTPSGNSRRGTGDSAH